MNTESKITSTKTALKSLKVLIAKIQKNIESAPNFESAQALKVDLDRADFELQAGEKSLVELEQQAAEETRQVNVTKYQEKFKEYLGKLSELNQHEQTMIAALNALGVAFDAHFKLSSNLKFTRERLASEAKNLNLEDPPRVPFGSPRAEEHIFELVKRSGSKDYISRLLSVEAQPITRGGWINTGK